MTLHRKLDQLYLSLNGAQGRSQYSFFRRGTERESRLLEFPVDKLERDRVSWSFRPHGHIIFFL
jgi:hypothetical protein